MDWIVQNGLKNLVYIDGAINSNTTSPPVDQDLIYHKRKKPTQDANALVS